uniref:macro domain-containing protein n=1 Tax=Dialister sp. TaxID=1955814 RepID=UPI004026FCC7
GCQTGEAKITKGYLLPCRCVIHTVGPVWHGGSHGERKLLASCYRKSLALAVEYRLESIAFPLISSGAYGYPKEEALEVAVDTIRAFLKDHDLDVYLVIFQKSDYQLSKGLVEDISAFLKEAWKEKGDPHAREEERLDTVSGELESLFLEGRYPEGGLPPCPYEESRHCKKRGIRGRIERVELQIERVNYYETHLGDFFVDSKREEQFFSEVSNPHFKWGFIWNPSGVLY